MGKSTVVDTTINFQTDAPGNNLVTGSGNTILSTDLGAIKEGVGLGKTALTEAFDFGSKGLETSEANFDTVNATFENVRKGQERFLNTFFDFTGNIFDRQQNALDSVINQSNETQRQVVDSFTQAATGVSSEAQNNQQKIMIVAVVVIFGILAFKK